MRIDRVEVRDIRFPTSRTLDGSDAMNPDPDYSAAYVVLHTSGAFQRPRHGRPASASVSGHGLAFTIGRGNEIVCSAIRAIEPLVLGHEIEQFADNPGEFWRYLTGDSQLRWLGPEKGVIHLATAAVVNALWDVYAKAAGLPLWRLLSQMTPAELVACIDFRYLTNALTPSEALGMLAAMEPGKAERTQRLAVQGYPAYTTGAGWLGYSDDKLRRLCTEGIARGWTAFKIKVGRSLEDDRRRCRILRESLGWDRYLMMDANQVWEVSEAIDWMRSLAEFKPWWIEEPTSPDDVLGHAEIARALNPLGIGVATGEHGMNRVLFKQLLQANAIQFCQIDACRLGGVNEVLAVLILAKKYNIPVCPHAGGVGLCEHVQHLSALDYIAISGSLENRVIEYVDHLHEHFIDPVTMNGCSYQLPKNPGYSTEMRAESMNQFEFPSGAAWKT